MTLVDRRGYAPGNAVMKVLNARIWRLYGGAICLLSVCLSIACRPTPVPSTQMLAGSTMGTSYAVKFIPQQGVSLIEVSERVESELDLVNRQMSTYLSASELSRFNSSKVCDEWFPVSKETAMVVGSMSFSLSNGRRGSMIEVAVVPGISLLPDEDSSIVQQS